VAKTVIDPADNLIADVVRSWASEKHERLRQYIDASRGVRGKFLPPRGTGGATYIELFSGPGRSFVEDDKTFIDGSALVAYESARKIRKSAVGEAT
jgi:three-Cys-motif partner protein